MNKESVDIKTPEELTLEEQRLKEELVKEGIGIEFSKKPLKPNLKYYSGLKTRQSKPTINGSFSRRQPDGTSIGLEFHGVVDTVRGSMEEVAAVVLEGEMHGNNGTTRVHLFLQQRQEQRNERGGTATITLEEATRKARAWAREHQNTSADAGAALAYINAIGENRDMGKQLGQAKEEADRTQYTYILCNLRYWRGPEAQGVKKAIRAFLGIK